MKRTLAPIVLFVYNRLDHTQRTLESLKLNILAKQSELFIFSDAPKNEKSKQSVNEVRKYINSLDGFKNIHIIEQKDNQGLAKSIISGVSKVVNKYGKVIVVEDDLVSSPYFLNFMNDALDKYENEKKVWHVSGWNYPMNFVTEDDVYFYRVMNCWGWATWADKWNSFEKNTNKLTNEFSKQDIKRFNLDGYNNLWKQVKLNKSGKINTWAIYWYATIFQNDGLCLNPIKSYVRNIGLDGTGEHCNMENNSDNVTLNNKQKLTFIDKIEENNNIVTQIKKYIKQTNKSLSQKVINKIKTKMFRLMK